MPDGIGISDRDRDKTEISVVDYLNELLNYLNRLTAFGAMTTEQANGWMISALRSLGYESGADFEAKSVNDNRVINMGEAEAATWREAEAAGVEGMEGIFARARERHWAEHRAARMPIDIDTHILPLFRQVVAPITHRVDAIREAAAYGYEEGSSQWKALVNVKALQGAEQYQMSYINEWLTYYVEKAEFDTQQAKAAAETTAEQEYAEKLAAIARKRQAAQVEAWDWMTTQRVEAGAEIGRAREAEERAEAWARETEAWGLGKERRPRIPTGEKVVREFLEEERPGKIGEFIRGKLPGVLEEFEREMGGARRAWWRAISRPGAEAELSAAEREVARWEGVIETGVKKGLKPDYTRGAYEMTPTEWLVTQAPQRLSAAQEALARLQGRTPEQISRRAPSEREDPLVKYLAQYPWQAEWLTLSPQQRGFQPSRYSPAARWFV